MFCNLSVQINSVKLTHKLLVFIILAIGVSACFDPPVFPLIPEIEFVSISFGETPDFSDPDSLYLRINFKDGDGNIGINQVTTTNGQFTSNINDPFHDSNFYLSTGGSSLKEIGTETFYTDTFRNGKPEFVPIKILTTRNQTGKLVSLKNQANFNGLPSFNPSKLNCQNFKKEKLFVFIADWDIIDDSYAIASDTLTDGFGNEFIELKDTLYFQPNPNHYTIEVDFFVKEPNHPDADATGFREYDWRKEFCTTYDGRFSQLSDTSTPLEGTLGYSMESAGFKFIFSVKTLKLRISIKDRDFNVSNVIFTPEFTLDQIKAR